jgi:hypothetical protein
LTRERLGNVFSQEFFFSGADSTPCYHDDRDAIDNINFDDTKLALLGATVTADLIGAHRRDSCRRTWWSFTYV